LKKASKFSGGNDGWLPRKGVPMDDLAMDDLAVKRFRRDCIESMVCNTADNIHDTGNSLAGVTLRETAAYYLVRASYEEGDLDDVAVELIEAASRHDAEDYGLTDEEFRVASLWGEDEVKVEAVGILRQMTGHPLARDLLLRCSDVIEGLFDEACPWPEMSELMDEICKYLKEGE